MPRVSVEQLDSKDPTFAVYRERREPFILTGAMEGWGALSDWPKKWRKLLSERWPGAVVDFYPYNMLSQERQSPFLTRLPRAIKELELADGPQQQRQGRRGAEGSRFRWDPSAADLLGRYKHLQLTPKMWLDLEERGEMSPLRHWQLRSDGWLEECLGHPESDLTEEFHLKNHWKIMLVGAAGAGMFNHSDSLMTSSWHAHVLGSKWWYLCGDLSEKANQPFQKEVCYEDILLPGEILYYGQGWHHETQNLQTPTMTITDTVAHEHNFEAIADQLHATCVWNKLQFEFSAALCDALDRCYATLHQMHRGAPKKPWQWPAWRSAASTERIAEAEATLPHHNNYDGRNYITE